MKSRSKIEFRVKSIGPSAENLFQALEPRKKPAPSADRVRAIVGYPLIFDICGVDLVCELWN